MDNRSVVLKIDHKNIQLYISPEDGPWGLKGKKENKKKGELKY
jgi:hypothetical protein